jgi:hypothetical protein
MTKMLEVLVILNAVMGAGGQSSGALDEIRQRHRLVGAAPPRLIIVEADEAALETLRGASGVEKVLIDDLPEDILASLGPSERLFAKAWHQRQQAVKKDRRGEGLNWDAPGFQPPDPPNSPDRKGQP